MNHIFRTIWNAATKAFSAVSELQSSSTCRGRSAARVRRPKGDGCGRRAAGRAAFVPVIALLPFSVAQALTWESGTTNPLGDSALIDLGSGRPGIHYQGEQVPQVVYDGKERVVLDVKVDNIKEDDTGAGFAAQSEGFIQPIFSADDFTIRSAGEGAAPNGHDNVFAVRFADAELEEDPMGGGTTQLVSVGLHQKGREVGKLRYGLGPQALDYLNSFGYIGNDGNDFTIKTTNADGKTVTKAVSNEGYFYEWAGNPGTDDDYFGGKYGLGVVAMLYSVESNEGGMVRLSPSGTASRTITFRSALEGNGGYAFGADDGEGGTIILDGFYIGGKLFENGIITQSSYKGPTTVDNVTLVLKKSNALGETSGLTADHGAMVLAQKDLKVSGDVTLKGGATLTNTTDGEAWAATLSTQTSVQLLGGKLRLKGEGAQLLAPELLIEAGGVAALESEAVLLVDDATIRAGGRMDVVGQSVWGTVGAPILITSEGGLIGFRNADLTVHGTMELRDGTTLTNTGAGRLVVDKIMATGSPGELSADFVVSSPDMLLTDASALGQAVLDTQTPKGHITLDFESGVFTHRVVGGGALTIRKAKAMSLGSQAMDIGSTRMESSVVHLDLASNRWGQLGKNLWMSDGSELIVDATKVAGSITLGEGLAISSDVLDFSSGGTSAKIIVRGSGRDFTVADGALADYNGWVRLEDARFSFDNVPGRMGPQSGLSLGSGTIATLRESAVAFPRLAWGSGEGTAGTLDLTGYAYPSGQNGSAPITVEDLYLNANGVIVIDAEQETGGFDPTEGSILDMDDPESNRSHRLIAAGEIHGNSTIEIRTTKPTEDVTSDFYAVKDDASTAVVAVGHYGYTTKVDREGADQGVYLTYGLKTLELKNNIPDDAGLKIDLNRGADNPTRPVGHDLSARVTGEGRLIFLNTSNTPSEHEWAEIVNTANDMSGDVWVQNGARVVFHGGSLTGQTPMTAMGGALGTGGVALWVKAGSAVEMAPSPEEGGRTGQTLRSLAVDDGSVLDLHDGRLAVADHAAFTSDARLLGETDAELVTLKVLSFAEAPSALDDWSGTFVVESGSEAEFRSDLTSEWTAPQLAGAGKAVFGLDTTIADNRAFSGTYALMKAGTTFTLGDSFRTTHGTEGVRNAFEFGESGQTLRVTDGDGARPIYVGTVTAKQGLTIDVGSVQPGERWATGALGMMGLITGGSTITVTGKLGGSNEKVDGSEMLLFDDAAGWRTGLLQGADFTQIRYELNIDGLGQIERYVESDGVTVGRISFEAEADADKRSLGIRFTPKDLLLSDVLTLDARGATGDAATLNLDVHSTDAGGIRVRGEAPVVLSGSLDLQTLEVSEGSTLQAGSLLVHKKLTIAGELNAADDALITMGDGAEVVFRGGGDLTGGMLAFLPSVAGEDALGTISFEGCRREGELLDAAVVLPEHLALRLTDSAGRFDAVGLEAVTVRLEDGSELRAGVRPDDGLLKVVGSVDADSRLIGEVMSIQGDVLADVTTLTGDGEFRLVRVDGVNSDPTVLPMLHIRAGDGDTIGTVAYEGFNVAIGSAVDDDAFLQTTNLTVGAGSTLTVRNTRTADMSPYAVVRNLHFEGGSVLDLTTGITSDTTYEEARLGRAQNALSGDGIHVVSSTVHPESGALVTVRFDGSNIKPSSGGALQKGSILDMLDTNRSGASPTGMMTILSGLSNETLDETLGAMRLEVVNGSVSRQTVDFGQPNADGAYEKVAELETGLVLTALKGLGVNDGRIAVGMTGVTRVNILPEKLLHMDATASEQNVHRSTVELTGAGGVWYTGDFRTGRDGSLEVAHAATYTGPTYVTDHADITVKQSHGVGTGRLQVGGTLTSEEGDPASLRFVGSDVLPVENAVAALDVKAQGDLSLTHSVLTTASGGSISGKLRSDENSKIIVAGGILATTSTVLSEDFGGTIETLPGAVTAITVSSEETFALDHQVTTIQGTNVVDRNARAGSDFTGVLRKEGNGVMTLASRIDHAGLVLHAAAGRTVIGDDGRSGTRREKAMYALTTEADVEVRTHLVLEELQGGKGILTLRADLGSGSDPEVVPEGEHPIYGLGEVADGIYAKNAAGHVQLQVTPSDAEEGASEKITLLQAGSTEEGFEVSLVDETGASLEALTSGGYDYLLVREDTEGSTGTTVSLSSLVGDGDERHTGVMNGLYMGAAAAAQVFDFSVHEHRGERLWMNPLTGKVETTAVWGFVQGTHERSRDASGQLGLHTTGVTTVLGGDLWSTSWDANRFWVGLMGGWSDLDLKSHSDTSNLKAKGELEGWTVGLYAGWNRSNPEGTGPYADLWVQYGGSSAEFNGPSGDATEEKARGKGVSAALEAGWSWHAADFRAGTAPMSLWLEPRMRVTYFGWTPDGFENDIHDVTFEGDGNIRTSVGLKAYVAKDTDKGFAPFVSLDWVHDTKAWGTTVSGDTFEQDGAENKVRTAVGLDWVISESWRIEGNFAFTKGTEGYTARDAHVSARWMF